MKKLVIIILLCVSNTIYSQVTDSTIRLHTFLKTWWGVPYKWGGETNRGIDCSAFVREMYRTLHNKNIPRTSREQYKYVDKIEKENLRTGDLVFFKSNNGFWHVGYYLFDSLFAHSSNSIRKVSISNLNEPKYSDIWFSQGRIN